MLCVQMPRSTCLYYVSTCLCISVCGNVYQMFVCVSIFLCVCVLFVCKHARGGGCVSHEFKDVCVALQICVGVQAPALSESRRQTRHWVFVLFCFVFHFLIKSDTLGLTQSDTTSGDSDMNPTQLHAQLMPSGGSGFQVSLVRGRKWDIKQQRLPPGTAQARPRAPGQTVIS